MLSSRYVLVEILGNNPIIVAPVTVIVAAYKQWIHTTSRFIEAAFIVALTFCAIVWHILGYELTCQINYRLYHFKAGTGGVVGTLEIYALPLLFACPLYMVLTKIKGIKFSSTNSKIYLFVAYYLITTFCWDLLFILHLGL